MSYQRPGDYLDEGLRIPQTRTRSNSGGQSSPRPVHAPYTGSIDHRTQHSGSSSQREPDMAGSGPLPPQLRALMEQLPSYGAHDHGASAVPERRHSSRPAYMSHRRAHTLSSIAPQHQSPQPHPSRAQLYAQQQAYAQVHAGSRYQAPPPAGASPHADDPSSRSYMSNSSSTVQRPRTGSGGRDSPPRRAPAVNRLLHETHKRAQSWDAREGPPPRRDSRPQLGAGFDDTPPQRAQYTQQQRFVSSVDSGLVKSKNRQKSWHVPHSRSSDLNHALGGSSNARGGTNNNNSSSSSSRNAPPTGASPGSSGGGGDLSDIFAVLDRRQEELRAKQQQQQQQQQQRRLSLTVEGAAVSRGAPPTRTDTSPRSSSKKDVSPSRRVLARKSSLEELAELEEYVEWKQRELRDRGIMVEGMTARQVIARNQQRYERRRQSKGSLIRNSRRQAEKERIEAALYDLENEIEVLRRQTIDIQEKVERVEAERARNNRAPDVISMLSGHRADDDFDSISVACDAVAGGNSTVATAGDDNNDDDAPPVHLVSFAQRPATPNDRNLVTPVPDRRSATPTDKRRYAQSPAPTPSRDFLLSPTNSAFAPTPLFRALSSGSHKTSLSIKSK